MIARALYRCAAPAVVSVLAITGLLDARAQSPGNAAPVTQLPAVTVTAAAPVPDRTTLSPDAAAQPANTTVLDQRTIQREPNTSYGDLFRPLPGFNVSNYRQGGVASGITLRGFTDGEHGRDIAYFIDGVPVNDVSSIHTPNYADLNILIPETVQRIDIIRGPFSVEYGDSNLGGAINIVTKASEPYASVGGSVGNFYTGRTIGTYSNTGGFDLGGVPIAPFVAAEGYNTQGYRDNSDYRRYNLFAKGSVQTQDGGLISVRTQFYGTTFGEPDYLSRNAIRQGRVTDTGTVNSTTGGDKDYQTLVVNYAGPGDSAQQLSGTLYATHDYFARYSDFSSGQGGQREDRDTLGSRVRQVWTPPPLAGVLPIQFLIGANWRTDFIDTLAGPTANRHFTGPLTTNVGIQETGLGSFGQIQVKPLSWVKITAGTRYDHFFYDVSNHVSPGNSPHVDTGTASPKFGIAVTPTSWLNLYANYGQGFRSPDAAISGELLSNPRLGPLKLESKEVGAEVTSDYATLSADFYTTDIANEAFQAAPGLPVQNLGQSQRHGFDLEARVYLLRDRVAGNAVSAFVNYSPVTARLLHQFPARFVPDVPAYTLNIGIDFDTAIGGNGRRLFGEAYLALIGEKHLAEDNSLNTTPYQRLSGKVGYAFGDGWTVFGETTIYPGDRFSEIGVNFGPNTGATSADFFTSARPRVTVLAGVTRRFGTE